MGPEDTAMHIVEKLKAQRLKTNAEITKLRADLDKAEARITAALTLLDPAQGKVDRQFLVCVLRAETGGET